MPQPAFAADALALALDQVPFAMRVHQRHDVFEVVAEQAVSRGQVRMAVAIIGRTENRAIVLSLARRTDPSPRAAVLHLPWPRRCAIAEGAKVWLNHGLSHQQERERRGRGGYGRSRFEA